MLAPAPGVHSLQGSPCGAQPCAAPVRASAAREAPGDPNLSRNARLSIAGTAGCVALACRRPRCTGKQRRRAAALRALPRPLTEDPDGLIEAAKRYIGLGNKVVQQLGPTQAEDLNRELADDFEFVAPYVGPLKKAALVAATTGLDLGEGLPDFDARYHAFRLDASNPRRVWCQMRVRGTHTGALQFAGVKAEPGTPPVYTESPPEAVSFTFNEAGQVREITTGYPVDRRCGTTGGLGGLFGILEGIGYPLPTPLTRTCGEILAPALGFFGLTEELQNPELMQVAGLAAADALEEEQLLALTEKLIESRFGLDDASLLGEDFVSTGPAGGPLRKEAYLEAMSELNISEAFPDLDYGWRDLRVCPFDVNRVWFTSSPTGTHSRDLRLPTGEVVPATGQRWVGAPECGSAQFDKDGRCIALTGGYVMDRRLGNTNGLGGILGLREAVGAPSSRAWLARTPSQLWASFTAGS